MNCSPPGSSIHGDSPDKQKLRELITTRPALGETLKGALQAETEGY